MESCIHHDKTFSILISKLHFPENGVKRRSNTFGDTLQKKQKVNIISDSEDEQDIPVINLEDDLDETQNNEEKENQHNCNSETDKLEPHQEEKENQHKLHYAENGVKRHSSKFGDTLPKKQNVNIISVSEMMMDEDEQDIPDINLEDDHNRNNLIDEMQNNEDQHNHYSETDKLLEPYHKKKENQHNCKSESDNLLETCREEKDNNQHNCNSESDKLLEPQFEICWKPSNNLEPAVSPSPLQDPSEDERVKVEIRNLENEIAHCNKLITMYDEAEVDLDSTKSSYIKSEK